MKNWLLIFVVAGLASCSSRQAPAPVSSLSDIRAYYKKYPQGESNARYTVQTGDTLYSIAFRSGLDFRQLAALNKISEPYRIFPGQVLHLVGTSNVQSTYTASKVSKESSRSASPTLSAKSQTTSKQTTKDNEKKINSNKNVNNGVALANKTGYVRKVEDRNSGSEIHKPVAASSKVRWSWPIKGPILAVFSNAEHGNKGLDIGGAEGSAIKAAANGEVVYAGNALRGYGNLVIIRHNDDYLSAYAHNRRLLVKERDVVVSGQTIAEMGSTDAPSTRLHFEIRYRGKSVDPRKYLQ